jgi:hypothetical protein
LAWLPATLGPASDSLPKCASHAHLTLLHIVYRKFTNNKPHKFLFPSLFSSLFLLNSNSIQLKLYWEPINLPN